jgi:hypothetical protein
MMKPVRERGLEIESGSPPQIQRTRFEKTRESANVRKSW